MAEPVGSIRDPFGTRTAPRRQTQEGETRDGGRLTYKNGKWVETFNIREGQQSTLGGKPVTADGKGNWERIKYNSDGSFTRTQVGTYKPGIRYGGEKTIAPVNAPSVLNLNTPKSKDKKPPAPAKPAVKPSASLSIPPSAAQPGTGPKGNTVGSDADPETPGLQGPGAPAARVNANGLVSYGKDLSSLNKFTSDFTGGYELTDIKSAFQSNDLEGAYQNGSNTISTDQSKYTLPDGATPSNVGGKYSMGSGDISIENTGYKINSGSVPGTVGGNPADPQDGTSSKPDVADKIRTVRMERQSGRGSRRDPRNRGEDPDMFGGPEPSDASLVSPMYKNAKRNAIREAFFAGETSVKGAVAANAVAGYGKDSNGQAVFNVGGELVYAKDGSMAKAKNAAMEGRTQDVMQHLDMPEVATQPDTPAASELSPTPASTVKPGTIQVPENKGGSIEITAPMTTPSPAKFKEAQDFLTSNMEMLTRRTK